MKPIESDYRKHQAAMQSLVEGRHGDPFSLLGVHKAGSVRLVRTFQPTASSVELVGAGGETLAAMERVHPYGLFVAVMPAGKRRYLFRLTHPDGGTELVEDPYRFGSTLGDLDWGPVWSGYLGLFLQGCAVLAIGLGSLATGRLRLSFAGALLIGVGGIALLLATLPATTWLYAAAYPSMVKSYPLLVLLKFGLVLVMMGVPAIGFGATVPALLREQGALAIPVDCYPVDDKVPVFDHVYWGYGQRNLRAAKSRSLTRAAPPTFNVAGFDQPPKFQLQSRPPLRSSSTSSV